MTKPTRRAGGANYKAWFVSLLWIIHSKEARAGFVTNRHCVASNRAIKRAVVGLASSSNDNNNFDDFGGSVLGEASNASGDDTGDDLAKEFFKQVRAREETKQDDEPLATKADSAEEEEVDVWGLPKDLVIEEGEEDEPEVYPQQLLSEAEARALNRRPFSRRREVIAGKDAATRARKFTGRRDDDNNNNMMFLDSRQRRQRQQQQQGDDNVMRMMGENNLWLQQPEKAILVQAGIVLLMFIVFVLVGVTGGIGSYNDIGDATEGFEETIPDFNDSEVSVWL